MGATGFFTAAVCLAAGCLLVLLEAILPGFGLPGIAGGALLLLGSWYLGGSIGAGAAAAVLLILAILLGVAVFLLLRAAAEGKLDKTRVFLNAVDPAEKEAAREAAGALPPGTRGTAESALRPAGIGLFDGKRASVVTEGSFLEAGTEIEVLRADGMKTVVRAVSAE